MKILYIICSILLLVITINHYIRGFDYMPLFIMYVIFIIFAFIINRVNNSKFWSDRKL